MESSEDESIGLETVRAPQSIPPSEPDSVTQLEADDLKQSREFAKSAALHRTFIGERERNHLADECRSLRRDCRLLSEKLQELAPRFSALRKSYLGLKSNAGGSSLMMFAGSVLVSIAGGRDWEHSTKNVILAGGIAISLCGWVWVCWSLYAGGDAEYASHSGVARSEGPEDMPTTGSAR